MQTSDAGPVLTKELAPADDGIPLTDRFNLDTHNREDVPQGIRDQTHQRQSPSPIHWLGFSPKSAISHASAFVIG